MESLLKKTKHNYLEVMYFLKGKTNAMSNKIEKKTTKKLGKVEKIRN